MHIFGQSEKGPCTSLSTWPKYLNVLIYANWGGLMVKTNFDSEEGSLSNWGSPAGWWGLLVMLSASSELENWEGPTALLGSGQDNELCRASRPCWDQQKPAKHKGNAQRPRIPWEDTPTTPPYSKPLCAAWGAALLCLAAWRQQPSEEALRGAKGAKGGRLTGGGAGNYRLIRPNHVYFRGYRGS